MMVLNQVELITGFSGYNYSIRMPTWRLYHTRKWSEQEGTRQDGERLHYDIMIRYD